METKMMPIMQPNTWEAKVCVWIWENGCTKSQYTIADILEDVIKIDIRAVSKLHKMKISNALQRLGFTKQRRDIAKKGEKRQRPWFYIPPADAISKAPQKTESLLPDAEF